MDNMTDNELRQVVDDMGVWWDRGAHATAEARNLNLLIAAHLKNVESVEEDDTLMEIPEEMMVRLIRIMFQGPTAAIREAARLFIHEYTESLQEDYSHE